MTKVEKTLEDVKTNYAKAEKALKKFYDDDETEEEQTEDVGDENASEAVTKITT